MTRRIQYLLLFIYLFWLWHYYWIMDCYWHTTCAIFQRTCLEKRVQSFPCICSYIPRRLLLCRTSFFVLDAVLFCGGNCRLRWIFLWCFISRWLCSHYKDTTHIVCEGSQSGYMKKTNKNNWIFSKTCHHSSKWNPHSHLLTKEGVSMCGDMSSRNAFG